MVIRKFLKIFFVILIIAFTSYLIYSKFLKKKTELKLQPEPLEDLSYSSNIIENVNYETRDAKGNEYVINALQGEIDYSNTNIIFLTSVEAKIKLTSSETIIITSNFGKYNSENYDTIFSKNVKINYLDNKITGEYLDFSLNKNKMIISKNVIYKNLDNVLKADVMEMNIETKDTKIFMYEYEKKVNIKNIE